MPKILVADDNTNIQKMVSLAFEERGIDVISVGNGEAAVRRIPDLNPDLVLADIFMPVRNGYEVCEFVKKDSRFSHVPVILLVGAFDPLDEKEARRVGADGVLKKPFVPPDPLIAMVVSALEKNPKLAAELAKAREVVPEPEPMPAALEAPVKAEVKPLPDYPEPSSPEEAALVYGFGSGKRGNEEAASGAAVPVTMDSEDVAEDDSEHGAGKHDWRRAAMDFEIPEETSKSTAFAMEDSATAMFPSEKEVPPKHVAIREPEMPEKLIVAEAKSPVAADLAPVALAPVPVDAPPVVAEAEQPAVAKWEPKPAVDAAPVKLESSSSLSAVLQNISKSSVEDETEGPSIEVEQVSEPTFAARATHWMDAMASALKNADSDDPNGVDASPAVKMDLDAPEPVAEVKRAAAPVAAPQAAVEAVASMEIPAPVLSADQEADHDSFFADVTEAPSLSLTSVDSGASSKGQEPALELEGAAMPVRRGADPELVSEVEDSTPIAKDPALVEPPSVRVKPEPLLVDEERAASSLPSLYDKKEEPTELPFASMPPASNGSPASQEARASAQVEPVIDERIPTGPPPNRQALSSIPFLTPPPEVLAEAAANNRMGDADVDAMVRKVLERLEPQLHDLLSQGVLKPLVENLLQSELAKKEK